MIVYLKERYSDSIDQFTLHHIQHYQTLRSTFVRDAHFREVRKKYPLLREGKFPAKFTTVGGGGDKFPVIPGQRNSTEYNIQRIILKENQYN